MVRKKSFVSDNSIEILNKENEEDIEIYGFTEVVNITGNPIASFNFTEDAAALELPVKCNICRQNFS